MEAVKASVGLKISLLKHDQTRKRSNYKCIATWRPTNGAPVDLCCLCIRTNC